MNLKSALSALLIGVTASVGVAHAQTVALKVETDKPGAKIDRQLFGQFAEHLGRGVYEGVWVGPDSPIPNTRGIRNDVVAALKDLRVPNVRWPGGCFADEYHWRNGIGPLKDRPATLNPNWGGVIEPNTFGTHEFMDFVQQIGAEAYISVNVGSGTPHEAADWFEYMTTAQPTALAKQRAANGHPEPYGISFMGIGNESWGCGGSMTPEEYAAQLRIYARYTRNYNADHPTLKIAVGPDSANTGYTEAVMKAWKERNWSWDIDGLSLHYYTVGAGWPPKFAATGFGEQEYATLINYTLRMNELLATHGAIMDKYDPEKKIALVVDEWGAWLAPTPGSKEGFLEQQNSVRDAIIAALNINIFARHADRVRMANIAQMVNVLQAMILTDQDKLVLTPSYHVFHMYVPFQDATFLPVTFDAGAYANGDIKLPKVDAIAAKGKDGKTWLALTNIDPTAPVQFELTTRAKRAAGKILSAPKIDSVNTFAAPATVAPKSFEARSSGNKIALKLPPHSVAVIALED
ncbi:alpha-L-arabinofuranosidase [Steroidobacter agaridevorans]|uniref:non-reducing end alpha-L-arabinofuranosidase n=1 Tax=Steroidobacter agaridevorans TaxID=2695856 RepID=A0A829YBZ5_9GAMM|nr:alpha-L-arabinofuranosidase C-terminal domain-containing protein [Steroidobacter agaridevorans]GFE80122.1 alpha-L-arabinofuranosidase [Steroidobacter agaridevorans]